MKTNGAPVLPNTLTEAFAHVEAGGILYVATYTRCTVIDFKVLKSYRKVGAWLLKEEGDGYRMQSGKSSVYLMPGQLKYA